MVVAFYPGILPFVFSPEHQAHSVLKLVKIQISFEPCFLSWLAVSITTWSSASHSLKILLLAPTLLFFPCLCEFVLEKNKIFFFSLWFQWCLGMEQNQMCRFSPSFQPKGYISFDFILKMKLLRECIYLDCDLSYLIFKLSICPSYSFVLFPLFKGLKHYILNCVFFFLDDSLSSPNKFLIFKNFGA